MSDDRELHALRAEIDRTNRELRDTLQRRARLVQRIARRKRALGLPPADPAREQAMLQAMLHEPGEGFAREELRDVLTFLLGRYRELCVRMSDAP